MAQGNPPDLSYSEPDMRYEVSDPRPVRQESSAPRWLLLIGVLLLILGVGWYLWTTFYKTPTPAKVADSAPPPAPAVEPKEPAIQHPIQSGPAEPLPALGESDKAI